LGALDQFCFAPKWTKACLPPASPPRRFGTRCMQPVLLGAALVLSAVSAVALGGPMNTNPAAGAAKLPPEFQELLAQLPTNVDRRTGAALITQHLFPVSYRSLEAWPLPTRHVNGRAVMPTVKLFEIAFAKLNAAPVVMGGRRIQQAA
jgi:hypothetical protein